MNDQRPSGSLAHWLIRRAARRAPTELSPRLEEEWLADLAGRQGRWARLRLALGCIWATQIIAHEHALGCPAPASPAPVRSAEVRASRSFCPVGRRLVAVLGIAFLHVSVIYLLASGLMHTTAAGPDPSTQAVVLEDPHPAAALPPPAPPHLIRAAVEIPEPASRTLDAPGVGAPEAPTDASPSPTPADPTAVAPLTRIPGGPAAGFPNTQDYYPQAAIRLGERGLATVQVCVDPHGRLTAQPTLAVSSGSGRLDEASLRLATAGSGHYRPTTQNRQPVSACFPLRIRFELRQ